MLNNYKICENQPSLIELELDCLDEFHEFFMPLDLATDLISGTEDFDHPYMYNSYYIGKVDNLVERKGKMNERIKEAYNEISNGEKMFKMLIDLDAEMRRNFTKYPHLIEAYIMEIVSYMGEYVFIDANPDINWYRGIYRGSDSLIDAKNAALRATTALMIDHHVRNSLNKADKQPVERSIAEKYIIESQEFLYDFGRSLDLYCLHYGLDFLELQKKVGVFFFRERDLVFIKLRGFEDKLNDLISKQKNDQPETSKPKQQSEKKIIKPFPEYFAHDKRDEISVICKTVFNQNESPKDYAIMLCVLSQQGLISIQDKNRKEFYESWYTFINKPLPKRSNFFSINKHIYEKVADGFCFYEEDTDFLHLKENFNKALKNIS